MHDKEALYDNTLQLKQYANGLVEENHRLKTKLMQLEEELSRKSKILNSLMSQMGGLSSMQGIQRIQKEVHLFLCYIKLDPSNRSAQATCEKSRD